MLSESEVWLEAVSRTTEALESNQSAHWILGFSGGKDSTALLKVFVAAANDANVKPKKIDVIYCDTGVENPVLDKYVKTLFADLSREFSRKRLPFKTTLLSAPVTERFFVKIVGRGYPPPTNSFRWCTKALRIKPVSRFIANAAQGDAVVALGLRQAESAQRDRSLKSNGGGVWQSQVEGGRKHRLFLPILDFSVADVWETVFFLPGMDSINAQALSDMYRGASGECPIVKSPLAPPCATGRFGCWTCTVVRKDKSAQSLVDAGHRELLPFLEFRNWLGSIRNDPERRWSIRRNRSDGMGPFTLDAREEILERLRVLERETKTEIVSPDELKEIHRLWDLDIPFSG